MATSGAALHGLRRCLLSPATAVQKAPSKAFPLVQRRFLGNDVRGPDFDPLILQSWKLEPHVNVVCKGFCRPLYSYGELKQFSESLRLLLFVGGSALVAADMLFVHPTQSAYWRLFSPLRWPALMFSPFQGPKNTKGVFDFEEEGCIKGADGTVKTAAYATFGKVL
ncbi:hypothetical protein cyc_07535 [Cyclospora cayetanensis]|uniref:Uncharacterized protein n=1 Tax=Cyclospora cayetanensis TaxID=88456 RepID=A0A1D3D8H8_9EIME|nr:hypothetical protein cyc_07535 [Cyclospora cayetanensis]